MNLRLIFPNPHKKKENKKEGEPASEDLVYGSGHPQERVYVLLQRVGQTNTPSSLMLRLAWLWFRLRFRSLPVLCINSLTFLLSSNIY